jgi:hypothetical protein
MAEEVVLHQPSAKCETIQDLDFEGCKPEHLGIDQLRIICDSLGLNVEDDVFPFLFDEDDGDGSSSHDRVYEQKDYVAAAYECLMVADETESHHLEDDHHFLAEVLHESPDILAQIVADVMETNPGLVEELVAELKQSQPELWNTIHQSETQNGKVELLDNPYLVSELVTLLLDNEPGLIGDIALSDDDEHVPDIILSGSNEEL